MSEEEIRAVVKSTIAELKKQGLLNMRAEYPKAAKMLFDYYANGEQDERIKEAIKEIEGDLYFEAFESFFRKEQTVEDIAEVYGVEVSTISRNKKRLSLKVYELVTV